MRMQPVNNEQASVQLFEHTLSSGFVVAEARLNSESTLNSLSLEMIEILDQALRNWAAEDGVVAVVLTAAGDRAFCAGGDIQALYYAMVRNREVGECVDDYPYSFFESEYRLAHLLHLYAKPVIAIGQGIVMGGGLGLFSAVDFRVVTERTRIAMPEVTIGLFPDAGATWLLRNLPAHVALFLAMTGSQINAEDALAIGVATHQLAAVDIPEFRDKLLALAWRGESAADAGLIDDCLQTCAPDHSKSAHQGSTSARPHLVHSSDLHLDCLPETVTLQPRLSEVVAQLRALRGVSPWVDAGLATLDRGCPCTVGIIHEQLLRARSLSLADCFRLEMTVATHCADRHDFMEGIRALLIEKDNSPSWLFGNLESLPQGYVTAHFAEPWPQNPLQDLEDLQ